MKSRSLNSSWDNLNSSAQNMAERTMSTLPVSPALLNLGNQAYLIELFPMAAYAVRAPDGVIAWFNSRAAQLWGRAPVIGDTDERFCGAHTLYHSNGSYMAHCDTPVALALETGASVHEEEVVIERPDGSRVTVWVHIDPIRDKDGTIVGVVNFFHDITERKQAERTTSLLAAIVDSSDDAIISKRLDGIITSWNGGAARLFGYTAQEAIGQHITHIVPPDRLDEEAMILERLRRGERVDHFETVRVDKDGRKLDVSVTISPVKDAAGHVIGASKVARNITERKQVEQALTERALLLDLSNDAILVRDGADRITYWNKSASALYGYSREEAMGRVTHKLLQTEFPEPLERITEHLQHNDRWTGELVHRRKDGSQIVVVSRWALDRDARGNPKSVLETNNDITQQKQSEKALRDSERRLRELADGLETQVFIRTQQLDHRNAEVLQQSEQLRELSNRLLRTQDEERRRIARDLHDSAGQIVTAVGLHLASITQHAVKPEIRKAAQESHEMIRQLSKEIRTVSYLLHPPLLDENGLSEAIRWYVKGLVERSDLKIELDIPEDFGRLPDELEVATFRIVQECVTNIHRHSGSKTATIRLSRNSENVSLEIQDSGTGIPVEKLEAIRTHRSGVGITGMRERIRRLQGNLDIQSNSTGTKISVTLPLMTNSSASTEITNKARADR
jgi:PAS domain S-box-containing protein